MANINRMGGQSALLTDITKAVWLVSESYNIQLSAGFLAGILNTESDALSRLSRQYEWQLHPKLFQLLERKWGPHSIDHFACVTNHLLPAYNSRYWDPQAKAVDDWAENNNFVNPPFRLLPQVLDIIRRSKCWATVIAPMWPAQPWFQLLTKMLTTHPVRIPKSAIALQTAQGRAEPLKNPKWRLFAWRICGANA